MRVDGIILLVVVSFWCFSDVLSLDAVPRTISYYKDSGCTGDFYAQRNFFYMINNCWFNADPDGYEFSCDDPGTTAKESRWSNGDCTGTELETNSYDVVATKNCVATGTWDVWEKHLCQYPSHAREDAYAQFRFHETDDCPLPPIDEDLTVYDMGPHNYVELPGNCYPGGNYPYYEVTGSHISYCSHTNQLNFRVHSDLDCQTQVQSVWINDGSCGSWDTSNRIDNMQCPYEGSTTPPFQRWYHNQPDCLAEGMTSLGMIRIQQVANPSTDYCFKSPHGNFGVKLMTGSDTGLRLRYLRFYWQSSTCSAGSYKDTYELGPPVTGCSPYQSGSHRLNNEYPAVEITAVQGNDDWVVFQRAAQSGSTCNYVPSTPVWDDFPVEYNVRKGDCVPYYVAGQDRFMKIECWSDGAEATFYADEANCLAGTNALSVSERLVPGLSHVTNCGPLWNGPSEYVTMFFCPYVPVITACDAAALAEVDSCNGHGTCTQTDGGPGSCACDIGYTPGNCTWDCVTSCGSHGSCSDIDTCSCDGGYDDPYCTWSCSTSCGSHGTCSDIDTCSCDGGYDDPYCTWSCSSPCGEHEDCTDIDTCECAPGYSEPDCSWTCLPACSTSEECVDLNVCQAPVCDPICALGQGTCVFTSAAWDTTACFCEHGFTGTDCGTSTLGGGSGGIGAGAIGGIVGGSLGAIVVVLVILGVVGIVVGVLVARKKANGGGGGGETPMTDFV